jgi:PAS domain S-box-containing protein
VTRVSAPSARQPASGAAVFSLLALASIPLILFLLGQLLAAEFQQSRSLRQAVDDSYRGRLEVQRLLSIHQDMETGQRGFVMTGDRSFLEPFELARREVEPALAAVERHLGEGSSLRGELQELRRLSAEKLRFSVEVVALRQKGRQDEAATLVAQGRGKVIMDQIRVRIGRIAAAEEERIATSTSEADAARRRSQRLTFILLASLAVLLFAAAWANHRSMQAKRATLRRLEDLTVRQDSIFNSAKDGILTLREDGQIETLNAAAARMYGYEPEELAGSPVAILYETRPEQAEVDSFLKAVQRRRKGDVGRVQEFSGRRKDGSTFPADVAVSPVRLADGIRYVAVIRDVTERKQVDQMKTEFVSTVSHELRTPLTSISGSLGLLKGGAAGELPERAMRLITIAHSNSERLVRLINDILDIEKIESGQMSFAVQPVELGAALEQAIEANRGFADSLDVQLVLEPVAGPALTLADPDRLMQVITNLLSNAAKFSPAGEQVTIGLAALADHHRITVADRGPGIPDEFKSRIFSKFAQADASDTRAQGGTGLGLSIVREIVARFGGSVGYEDRQGGGTVFRVDLPKYVPQGAHTAGPAGEPTLLHIDDDPDVLRVVASAFEGRARVTSAQTLDDARELLGGCGFDLIILDIALGQGSGLELLPQIHQLPCRAPVVLFTAQDADDQLAGQVDAVLTKSRASLKLLVETVEGLLAKAKEPG